jgi:AraC-like DNA-binding protein
MDKNIDLSFTHFKEYFWYGESNLNQFLDSPYRLKGGFVFFCTAGKAILSYGIDEYAIEQNTESIVLPCTTFSVKSMSDDFSVRLFTFSKELFDEVSLKLGFPFLAYLHKQPLSTYNEGDVHIKDASTWFDMAKLILMDINNKFLIDMQRNFLQNYLMYLYGRLQANFGLVHFKLTREQELFYQFMSLVMTHSCEQRKFQFYADKLHINSRYLYAAIKKAISSNEENASQSPKNLIDQYTIQKIKIILRSTTLTISQILESMDFPNPSHFSRYFKKHTGMSPSEYRKKINC